MKCIKVLTDEDFGLKSVPFDNPELRIGARGIVIREDGKIALFNKSNKNEYKLPGGGVDPGEDIEKAFIREAMEETGCHVEIIDRLGTIEEHKSLGNFKQVSHIFVGKVTNDTHKLKLTKKEKDEGAKLLWVTKEEALKLITDCYDKLKASNYENVYHSRFIVTRDKYILNYYINKND